jgi:hypothetical protein
MYKGFEQLLKIISLIRIKKNKFPAISKYIPVIDPVSVASFPFTDIIVI